MTRTVAAIALSLCAAVIVSAHESYEHAAATRKGSPEFEMIKKLSGKWKGTMQDENGKPQTATTEFHVVSAGSAIEETLGKGTPFEMVDMYVDQGGKLAMTHYCAAGNQPHMVLKSGDPKQIVLEMDETPGIDMAKDTHMHGLTIEFVDANHIIENWTSFEGGKAGQHAVFKLARLK